MISSVAEGYSSFTSSTYISKKKLTEDEIIKQMQDRGEDKALVELAEPEEAAELTDAQRYMINNVKALAVASSMIEEDEDDEDEDGKKSSAASKSGGELANISMSTSGGGGSSEGSASETEIVTMPDGSKVMVIKTEISNGVTTMVRIKLSSGKENEKADEVGKENGNGSSGAASTAAVSGAGAAAPAA